TIIIGHADGIFMDDNGELLGSIGKRADVVHHRLPASHVVFACGLGLLPAAVSTESTSTDSPGHATASASAASSSLSSSLVRSVLRCAWRRRIAEIPVQHPDSADARVWSGGT